MTAQEVADRVVTADLTGLRFAKLEALCTRMKVNLADVIALLPAEARVQAEALKA
jgi:DNA-binding Xre family transcriptional regulator